MIDTLTKWLANINDQDQDEEFWITSEQARELGDELGLPFIGEGSHRIVYGLDSTHVLKVAREYYGILSNLDEWDVWTAMSLNPAACQLVAQVYTCQEDGLWLVAEHLSTSSGLTEQDFLERREEFYNMFNQIFPNNTLGRSDDERRNFGLRHNGSLAMLDLESL